MFFPCHRKVDTPTWSHLPLAYLTMHWKASTLLLSAFAAGVAVAVGHHFFYQSLHGYPVDNTSLFTQEFNHAIGVTFAFLVKALLVFSIGVAYVQLLWATLRRKPIKLSTIDSLFGLRTNFTGFFKVRLWWKHLPLMALVSWYDDG